MKDYKKLRINDKKKFWKDNPIIGNIDITIDGIEPFKMYCDNDDSVIKELYWTDFKGWELTSLVLWNNILSTISDGLIYDIGSYSGIYSLISANASNTNQVHAFEIQENCVNRLRKNIAINSFDNIEIHQAACTNFDGEVTFYYYEEEGIISSVAGLVPNKMNNLERKVKAIKLDDFEINKKVDLIKIDVEGAELDTLKGMKNVLKDDAPDVLIEVNHFKGLKHVKKLFPRGYKVYDVNEDTLEIKKLGWFISPSKHRNYFFTKKSKDQLSRVFEGTVL